MKLGDIQIGQVCESSSYLISVDEIKLFADQYDPQPIHLDELAAAESPFGRLVASGWQTLCLTMKLISEARPFGETPVIGVGVDGIEFRKPVFPGTTIAARAEVISKRESSKPGRGFVQLKVETRNMDNGEIVVSQTWTVMVPA